MNGSDRRTYAALRAEHLKRQAERSLYAFLLLVWPILEPGRPFVPNWHVKLIGEYLEAVSAGAIQRLVINIPPRYGKSLLVSVVWPVWEWINEPTLRMIFCSYSEALASRHALDRRRLLQHPDVLAAWPHLQLTRDQHTKLESHNRRRGMMVATAVGAAVTGQGGNRLIIDDPHNPTQAASEALRQHAIDFYTQTLSTRLDDKGRDRTVLVMQRLHPRDLTGVCVDLGFEQLSLPALAPRRTTLVFPRSGDRVVREIDDPLWPERENTAQLALQRRTLGSYAFAAQYQQEPVPLIGGMFPRDWWAYYDEPPLEGQWLQSWDLTFKDGDGTDWVVGLVALRVGELIYLVDRYKGHANFTETCHTIDLMRARYPQTAVVLVEEAANGAAVVNTLTHRIPGLLAVPPLGGKLGRAAAAQPRVEAGQILLPRPCTPHGDRRLDRLWVTDFVETCAVFPRGAHDDDVDALSQLVAWITQHPHAESASVMQPPEPWFTPRYSIWGDAPRSVWTGHPRRRISEWILGRPASDDV